MICTLPLECLGITLPTLSNPFFRQVAVKPCFLQLSKVRVAQPLHLYEVRITGIFYYNPPAGQNSKRAMPPPPTPIPRPPQTLGTVSASESRQRKFVSTPLPLNRPSLSSATEPTLQRGPAISTFPMSPGMHRRPPNLMEHQAQSRIPRPSTQLIRQSALPQQRMSFRTGTSMGNTSGTTQGLTSTGHVAPQVVGLNGLLEPSRGRSIGRSGFNYKP